MKKIIFLLFGIFFSVHLFAAVQSVTWTGYGTNYNAGSCAQFTASNRACPGLPANAPPGALSRVLAGTPSNSTYNGQPCSTIGTGQCQYAPNPCVLPQTPTVLSDGTVQCSVTSSVPGQTQSSSAASSDAGCPSGQFKDGRGKCNTKCQSPNVYNAIADTCQAVTQCEYPQLYSVLSNSCGDNPQRCANGAGVNKITGECWAAGETSCPPGFSFADPSGLTCTPSQASNSSTGNSGSSSGAVSSGANTSTPSSSGAASSAPPVKPPVSDTDNSDQGQPTGGSHYIPAGTSIAACRTQNSQTVCNDYQNCQLTFGVDKCVGMTSEQSCPNSYVLNGQKYCVLSGNGNSNSSSGTNTSAGGSGSNSSKQKGECDPTAKNYDECMGRNEVPTESQTSKIKTDFDTAANKAIDDYNKAMKDDSEAFARDGIGFKSAPDSLKQAVLSHIPQASACQNITITFFNSTKSLNCALFEKFKLILAWFCSLVTIYYIYMLAIKPVQR
jgi:hypothetical protein